MNLTWHIIKKDLRALRWPLLLWTLLIIMKLVAGAMLLTADGTEDPQWFKRLESLAMVFAGLETLSVILVAALVQQDLLVGSSAFWVTRPISGGRLLRAKLAAIGLIFILWPLVVTLPWWLACGYGPRDLAGAAMETASIHLIVVLVGLLWAVVTDGYSRFILWALITLAAVPVVLLSIGMYRLTFSTNVADDVLWARSGLVIACALSGITTVVVHQFLTRRTARSIGIIVTTLVLMLVLGLWWPWSLGLEDRWRAFVQRQIESDWPASAQPPGLSLSLEQAELLRMVNAQPERPLQLRLDCRVPSLPADQALTPSLANQFTLRWSDGETKQGWSWIHSRAGWYDRVAIHALGMTPESADDAVLAQIHQMLPATVAARLQVEPAEFSLKAQFAVMALESSSRVPLVPGPREVRGHVGERIAHLDTVGEELRVTFVRHHPQFLSDTLIGMASYVLGVRHVNIAWFPQYHLVNRDRSYMDGGSRTAIFRSRVATVQITLETVAFRAMKPEKGHLPRPEAIRALNEAELMRLVYREHARFTTELKVPSLMVKPSVNN